MSAILLTACTRVDKSYWENGNLKSELPYRNGKLNGVARWYYEDGTLQQEVPYVDNKINGVLKRYHDNGRREAEETYVNDMKNGKAVEYTYPGKRIEQKYYRNDTLHGIYRKWHRNGKIQIEGELINGLYEGRWLYYNDDEELVGEGQYHEGNGTQHFWNRDGSKLSKTPYRNNLKHGREIIYGPGGEVEQVVEYEYGEIVPSRESF